MIPVTRHMPMKPLIPRGHEDSAGFHLDEPKESALIEMKRRELCHRILIGIKLGLICLLSLAAGLLWINCRR